MDPWPSNDPGSNSFQASTATKYAMSRLGFDVMKHTKATPYVKIKKGDIVSDKPKTEFERMIQFLDLAWKKKDQIVPCLVGPVGIGKTAAVNQHAKNVGAKNVVTIIASQILPSEVSGITMPDADTKSMEIYDHYKLSSLQDGDILFFDELLEADQCVLSACLTLIESRMMMSGRLLPDIQIIAATNPTVNPANIKENIRQRFMFTEFKIDAPAVADYIEKIAGFRPPKDALDKLESTGQYFNILSPRSLTKLCEWIASGKNGDEVSEISDVIDRMFGYRIGTSLGQAYISRNNSPEKQARTAMKEAFLENSTEEEQWDVASKLVDIISEKKEIPREDVADELGSQKTSHSDMIDSVFKETSMDELLDIMQSLSGWDKISETLSNMQVEELVSENVDF